MEDLIAQVVVTVVFGLLAGIYDNHFWRMILVVMYFHVPTALFGLVNSIIDDGNDDGTTLSLPDGWMGILFSILSFFVIWCMPHFVNLSFLPRTGCVFITGCDSGMGQATVMYFAKGEGKKHNDTQYDQIFAGCYDPKASIEYFEKNLTSEQLACVTVVPLDVTKDDSVHRAGKVVRDWMNNYNSSGGGSDNADDDKKKKTFLSGVLQFHGIGYNGPAQYMPVEMYERQLQVNFVGDIRVVQTFLPILRKRPSNIPGRIVFTGTGGGPCTPCPPLLTAYMSSKFAVEAYCHALRQELYMTNSNIEAVVINPGFVKPTMIMTVGKRLTDNMWKICEEKFKSTIAKDEYGKMMDHFIEYSTLQPGTHVSEVAFAAEHALLSKVPRTSYKVGIDSKVAPIVGMMPTGMRELIARHGIYGVLSPAGTVTGYKV